MHRLVVADDHPIVFRAVREALPSSAFRVVAECVDAVSYTHLTLPTILLV